MTSCISSSSWQLSSLRIYRLPSRADKPASKRACSRCPFWYCQQIAERGDDQLQQQLLLEGQRCNLSLPSSRFCIGACLRSLLGLALPAGCAGR